MGQLAGNRQSENLSWTSVTWGFKQALRSCADSFQGGLVLGAWNVPSLPLYLRAFGGTQNKELQKGETQDRPGTGSLAWDVDFGSSILVPDRPQSTRISLDDSWG